MDRWNNVMSHYAQASLRRFQYFYIGGCTFDVGLQFLVVTCRSESFDELQSCLLFQCFRVLDIPCQLSLQSSGNRSFLLSFLFVAFVF